MRAFAVRHSKHARLSLSLAAFLGGGGLALYLYIRPSTHCAVQPQPSNPPSAAAAMPSSSSSSSSPSHGDRFLPASETSRASADTVASSIVHRPSRHMDDTLPTPPATDVLLFPSAPLLDSQAGRWQPRALAEEPLLQQWMLHETQIEDESDDGEGAEANKGGLDEERQGMREHGLEGENRKHEETCDAGPTAHAEGKRDCDDGDHAGEAPDGVAHATVVPSQPQAFAPEEATEAVGEHLSSGPPRLVSSRSGDDPSSVQESSSPAVVEALTNSSSSTAVIDVPVDEVAAVDMAPSSARSTPSAHGSYSDEVEDGKDDDADDRQPLYPPRSAAQSRRAVVLISPAVDETATESNVWVSPDRIDEYMEEASLVTESDDTRGSQVPAVAHSAQHAQHCVTEDGMEAESQWTGREEDGDAAVPHPTLPTVEEHSSCEVGESLSSPADHRDGLSATATPARVDPPLADERLRSLSEEPVQQPLPPHIAQTLSSTPSQSQGVSATEAAEHASPHTRNVIQRLRLQLNQAERAAALQRALHDAAQSENADLRGQLDELLAVQVELERRGLAHEAALAEAEQRRVAAQSTATAEAQRLLAEQAAVHEERRRGWERDSMALQQQLAGVTEEARSLQAELAESREELRAMMRDDLKVRKTLEETAQARAAAEDECAALRRKLQDGGVEQNAAAGVETQTAMERLAALVWEAEERAAVSELAFRVLCERLCAAAESVRHGLADSLEVSALSTASQDPLSPAHLRADASFQSARGATGGGGVDESVLSSLSANALQTAVAASTGAQKLESLCPGQCQTRVTAVVPSPTTLGATDAFADEDVAPTTVRPLSSNTAALLRQRQQEVHRAVANVVEDFRRIARETRSAADSRAAKMEGVLSAQLRQLRAQLEAQKQQQQQQQQQNAKLTVAEAKSPESPVGPPSAVAGGEPRSRISADPSALSPKSSSPHRRASAATSTDDQQDTAASLPSVSALQSLLAETQRALMLERRHTALLRRDVEDLHEARYTATILSGVEETLRDVQAAVAQSLQDAVDDMLSLEHAADAVEASGGDEEGNAGRWTRIGPAGDVSPTGQQRRPLVATRRSVKERSVLSSVLDREMLRSIQKAALGAEAQVERAGEELFFHSNSTNSRRVAYDSSNRLPAVTLSVPLTQSSSASPPYGSFSVHTAAAPMSAPPRSEAQQRVLQDMHALLQRSQTERHSTAAGGPIQSFGEGRNDELQRTPPSARYSPSGARWMSGIRPPPPPASSSAFLQQAPSQPLAPAGSNVTPARPTAASAPSPYVQAYLQSAEPTSDRHTSFAAARHSVAVSDTARGHSSAALQLYEGMTAAAQELRNVGCLLETVKRHEDTREERLHVCLQEWEERIKGTVEEAWRKVQRALSAVRRPNGALERFSSARHEHRAAAESIDRTPAYSSYERERGSAEGPVPQVRLADVLAGKSASARLPASAASSSSGAVVFSHP